MYADLGIIKYAQIKMQWITHLSNLGEKPFSQPHAYTKVLPNG